MRKSAFVKILFGIVFLLVLGSGSFASGLTVSHRFSLEGPIQPTSWKVVLEFDKAVSVLELSRRISYKFGGKPQLFKIINATDTESPLCVQPLPSDRDKFVLEPKEVSDSMATCTIVVSKELTSVDGKNSLDNDLKLEFQVRETVEIGALEEFYESSDKRGIRFQCSSQGVSESELKSQIRIFPPIGRISIKKTSGNRNDRTADFDLTGKFETGKTYQMHIRGGKLDYSDRVIAKAVHTFTAKGPKPAINFEVDRSVMELKSRQLIPVSLMNVDQVRCQLTRIPAFFAPEFSDLTLLAKNDARRPRNSETFRAKTEDEDEIKNAAKAAEQKLVEGVNRLAEVGTLANNPGMTELPWFLGDFTHAKEVFFNDGKADKIARLSLPMGFRKDPEKGGTFLIQLFDSEESQVDPASRLFQITDLCITYKFSEKKIVFWVTSMESGKPVPNAAVMIFTKNDERLFLGKTDKDGLIAALEGSSHPAITWNGGSAVATSTSIVIPTVVMALAATESDSCFIQLDSNRFRPFSVVQAVPGKVSIKSRNAHIFTERGVYKPGETVFWKASVRKYEDNSILPPEGDSVTVRINNSRSEMVFEGEFTLNAYGTCSGSFALKDFSPLGEYSVSVLATNKAAVKNQQESEKVSWWGYFFGKDNQIIDDSDEGKTNNKKKDEKQETFLTSASFQVQHFESPRHFVTIGMKKKSRENSSIIGKKYAEDYVDCRIESKYYTGGFLKHAKVRWTAYLVPVESSVTGFDGFFFGNNRTDRSLIESGESLLDKDGGLNIQFPLDKSLMGGLYGVEVSATVLDVDGRPATNVEVFDTKPTIRLGITNLPSNLKEGDGFPIDFVAINESGQKINTGVIRLEILRKRHFYSQKRDEEGNIYYRWDSGWVKTLGSEQPIKDGRASFEMVFDDSGEYVLQGVYSTPDNEFQVSYMADIGYTYDYDDDGDGDSRHRRRSENEIILNASKGEAAVNEAVKFDFAVPRPATHALITCERDGIYEYRVVPVVGKRGNFDIKLNAECRPNAFVSVTIPCGRSTFPVYKTQVDLNLPKVYFGVTKVKVKESVKSFAVAIQEDGNSAAMGSFKGRPGEIKKLSLHVSDEKGRGLPCEMAVCVVDEAVLALTGYVTPVLSRLADFSLPLSVFTGDLHLSLITQELYKLFATNALTGGDGGAGAISSDIALRKDFRPVAYWNPALYTDEKGDARIEFKLPDTTTAYRIYVVALDKQSSFCSAEKQMVVSKEFFLQPGLPRFLTSGDQALFPLSACNKTDTSGLATLNVVEAKNLTAKLTEDQATLTPLANTIVKAALDADNGPGDGSLTFSGRYGAFSDAIQNALPIVPRYIPIRRVKFGSFTSKTDIEVDIPEDVSLMPLNERKGVLKATLGISQTMWSKIAPGLRYLLSYPYGCVEQTSSGIIPLAALRKLVVNGMIPGLTLEEIDKFLKPGIARLLKMQTFSGGFAYWPGERQPNWWGTQYAVFALHTAKTAGYEVPEKAFEKAIKFIRDGLFGEGKNSSWHDYGIYELAAVNLALAGSLTTSNLEVLVKDIDKKELEGRAILLWADALTKLHTSAKLKEMAAKLKPKIVPSRYDWYDSSTREMAIALIATLQVDPGSKQADDFAGSILAAIKPEGRWHSTADTGWCLFALSKYFERKINTVSGDAKIKILQAGKPPIDIQLDSTSKEFELDAEALLKNGKITLENPQGKMVHYTLNLTYPDLASRTDDLDQGFRVEKRIKNLNGSDEIRVGDVVKVSVEFEDDDHYSGRYGSHYEYLAVDDPLPAGFVAINSALKSEQKPVEKSEGEEGDDDDEEWYSSWEDGAYNLHSDHFEMRDDRVCAFKNRIWSGKFRLTYFARAVCEGEFWLRPTRVSLMYDPETFGLTQGTKLKILPPK